MSNQKREPRRNVQMSLELHARFKAVAKAHRTNLKIMMEIMVEEFEKRLKGK